MQSKHIFLFEPFVFSGRDVLWLFLLTDILVGDRGARHDLWLRRKQQLGHLVRSGWSVLVGRNQLVLEPERSIE